MSDISQWKDTAAANNAAPPDGWPEGQAPSTVNNCAREMMAAIRRQWQQGSWFDYGLNVSLKSQNKIKIASSSYTVTDVFQVGRRVKVVSNSTTVYGAVSTVSSSSSARLVAVNTDSGTLTSTVSQVSISILEAQNTAVPGGTGDSIFIEQDGNQIYAADSEASDAYVISLSPAISSYTTGQVINFKANTANTGAATLNVNGQGAVTIKKNHDQDLEDGDIESGQIVTVVYDGTNFQMQSQLGNAAAAQADFELIESQDVLSVAEVEFTNLSSDYFQYKFVIENFQPATDDTRLQIETSADNGVTYDTTAGNYRWANVISSDASAASRSGNASATSINLTQNSGSSAGLGNATGEVVALNLYMYNPGSAQFTLFSWTGHSDNALGRSLALYGAGRRTAAEAVDAIRFYVSSGNIASGRFRLYGLRGS